jgi:twitching motility two-component system response regulator PilH
MGVAAPLHLFAAQRMSAWSRRGGKEALPMAKVMVVDDAVSELKLMESILKGAGHQVLSFVDGDQLEDKCTRERPDLVLLDIVMPKRNGYEILRSLKKDERTRALPVVLVSSKNQESDRVWGKRQGADD